MSVDLRHRACKGETVRDQGSTGNCAAHVFATMLRCAGGWVAEDVSVPYLSYKGRQIDAKFEGKEFNPEVDEGITFRALAVVCSLGFATTSEWSNDEPFARQPKPEVEEKAIKRHLTSVKFLSSHWRSSHKWIDALRHGRPVGFALELYPTIERFFENTSSRQHILPFPKEDTSSGTHALVCVGYSPEVGPSGAFLVQNSWGKWGWGEEGYFWMPVEFVHTPVVMDAFVLGTVSTE